jgi:hypothetical protein
LRQSNVISSEHSKEKALRVGQAPHAVPNQLGFQISQPAKALVPIFTAHVNKSLRKRNRNDATHKNSATFQPQVIGALGKPVAGSASAE